MEETKALTEAQRILNVSLQEKNRDVEQYDPSLEVDRALASIFYVRAQDIREDLEFKKDVQAAVSARIAEFNPGQLTQLLGMIMANTNVASDRMVGPILESRTQAAGMKTKSGVEDEIFVKSSKEMLQSFNELFTMVSVLKRNQDSDGSSMNIKEALAKSVEDPVTVEASKD
jgi:hypothetical protein